MKWGAGDVNVPDASVKFDDVVTQVKSHVLKFWGKGVKESSGDEFFA